MTSYPCLACNCACICARSNSAQCSIDLAVAHANHVQPQRLEAAARRRKAHELALLSAAIPVATRHDIAGFHAVLYREAEIREARAQRLPRGPKPRHARL